MGIYPKTLVYDCKLELFDYKGVNIFQAVLLGIIEGVTEFLPISSTFHLIWGAKLMGIGQTNFLKMFEVVIQSGAILAIVALYFQTIFNLKLWKKVIVSFIPTALVGLILYKIIKGFFFENFALQITVFVLVGVFFIVFERLIKNTQKTIAKINYKQAFLIGLVQALAVIPGVSRAGAVIVVLLCLGVKRDEAAKYSFLLAIPTLMAATLLDLIKSRAVVLDNIGLLLIGLLASFISAYIVVKWFVSYLSRHDMAIFGWYRLGLALILLKTYFLWYN